MIVIFAIIVIISVTTYLYLRQPQFGALPQYVTLEFVKKLPNYKNGAFRNVVEKPTLNRGYTTLGELYRVLFKEYPNKEPIDSLPAVKTNLKAIPRDSNVIVWFGHSLSHDHYDHLDYQTARALQSKVKFVISPTSPGSCVSDKRIKSDKFAYSPSFKIYISKPHLG